MICLLCSIIVIVVGACFLYFKGFNLSIDYKTGTDITIVTDKKLTKKSIESDLSELNIQADSISISKEETSIRVNNALNGDQVKDVNRFFEDKYNAKVNIGVVTNIVQRELVKNAILAVCIALVGIIIYVSIRFRFSYALGGTIALIHDVFIMFSCFAIFRFQVSSMFIAAVLAIIGYSINDTIVSFDRIREHLTNEDDKKLDAKRLEEICNLSIQETFTRTIYTSITTLLPVVVLMILGSSGIFTFNVAMLIGLIAGTYSSIFIAIAFFMMIEKKSLGKKKKVKKIYKDQFEEKKIKGINC